LRNITENWKKRNSKHDGLATGLRSIFADKYIKEASEKGTFAMLQPTRKTNVFNTLSKDTARMESK
jgi:hypothetical protein